MKPSGPGLLFVERFLITVSISLLVDCSSSSVNIDYIMYFFPQNHGNKSLTFIYI